MLIGELSKRSGLGRDTIRFYEKEGLIAARKPDRKSFRTNTYKDYPEDAVAALRFVQRTKSLGFTLAEIRGMLAVRAQGQPSRKWAAEAEAKLAAIEIKLRELQEVKALLGEALARCGDRCLEAGCEVLDGPRAQGCDAASAPPAPRCGGQAGKDSRGRDRAPADVT